MSSRQDPSIGQQSGSSTQRPLQMRRQLGQFQAGDDRSNVPYRGRINLNEQGPRLVDSATWTSRTGQDNYYEDANFPLERD